MSYISGVYLCECLDQIPQKGIWEKVEGSGLYQLFSRCEGISNPNISKSMEDYGNLKKIFF